MYKKGSIYSAELNKRPQKICSLKRSFLDAILSKSRLLSRLFRLDPRAAAVVDKSHIIISLKGRIINIDMATGEQNIEHYFRQGMNNPLNFCKISCISGFEDTIVYGEYWGNPDKEPVAIYGRENTGVWEKLYEFPNNSICHIHNIIGDKYTNTALILTGDSDSESGIWVVKENFKNISPLLVGKQMYRSCCVYPTEDGIIYATDTPIEQNYIFKFSYSTQAKVNIEKKYEMPGPCIFSTMQNGQMIFSTSVESDPNAKLGGIKSFFDFTRGTGVKTNFSKLIFGNEKNGFSEIASFEKDILPMAFQFGNISFPINEDENLLLLVIYPQCVKKFGGNTVLMKIDWEAN